MKRTGRIRVYRARRAGWLGNRADKLPSLMIRLRGWQNVFRYAQHRVIDRQRKDRSHYPTARTHSALHYTKSILLGKGGTNRKQVARSRLLIKSQVGVNRRREMWIKYATRR